MNLKISAMFDPPFASQRRRYPPKGKEEHKSAVSV
jgi:hypothetical protein